MQLPSLISGKRFTLPRPAGSADAVLLAQLAQREKKAGTLKYMLIIVYLPLLSP